MIGWQNTRNALEKLEELLTCKVCANLVSDPCSLEACDHIFCRDCIKKLVGADSKCPECGAFAWVKDMKTNHQLANTVNMCAKMRMLIGADDDCGNSKNNMHANNVVWEETQATFEQDTDSYQFSSPEVIEGSSKSMNKCDATVQEISLTCSNRQVFKVPAVKTYGKAKKETSAKGRQTDTNSNGAKKHIDTNNVENTAEQGSGKVLMCQNGTLSSRQGKTVLQKGNGTVLNNPKVPKRVKAKEKCFGKELKRKKVKETVGSVVSPCSDQEIENKEGNSKKLRENMSDNLLFGANNDDSSIMDIQEQNDDEESFTRVKSREEHMSGSSVGPLDEVDGTPEEVTNILRTRAQKRKMQGTHMRTLSKTVPEQELGTSSETSRRGMSKTQRKNTKSISTETPVKQGKNKRKILGQNFCSPQSSSTISPGAKRNKRGETPLHVAAIKGCLETVKRMLAEGADPNTKDHAGWTPLHEACNHGYLAIVEMLLDHGAMIDIPGGFDHDTPLHDAITNGRLEVARLLVSKEASLDIRNKRGLLPIDYAATEEMRSLLSTVTSKKDGASSTRTTSLPLSGKCSQDSPKVLLATGLSSEQKANLQKCSLILNAEIVNEFSLSVSHIVTATNSKGICPRTIKYLNGVVTGKWIVNYEWIEKCLRRKTWLDETPYEIKGTNDDAVGAPKTARINSLKQLPGLFDGCQFYFFGEFSPHHPPKKDLIQMVKYGGGKILSREPKPDVDESLCLPTSNKVNKAANQAFPLAPVAYHANPESKQYRCTQYVIYDALSEKKPHIWNTHSVCTMPLTWLMDCASNFAIVDLMEEH